MAEKDLANDMKKEKEHSQELLEKIRKIEDEIKQEKGNNNINVKYYEKCELTIAGRTIEVSIAEVEEKRDSKERNIDEVKDKEESTIKTYNIYINDVKIGEINEEGRLIIDEEAIEKVDPKNFLGLKELGDEEKPDISEINRLEGKTAEELEEELGYEEELLEEEQDLEDTKEKTVEKDEKQVKKYDLQEINIAVLKVINPKLQECTKAYLDRNTNSLIFKDKEGEIHNPEEYGFYEKKVETGNFELNKMSKDGEISLNENPTKVYGIEGNNYGISTDFKTHHREVNVIVKNIDQHHANRYSVIDGNLTKSDSGDITKYQAEERVGVREGEDAGETNDANKEASKFLSDLSKDDANKFRQGFEKEMQDNYRINDKGDLKRVIADVLQKEYHENAEDAKKIAENIVEDGREYAEIKKEINETEKAREKTQTREPGGFGPWDNPRDRRGI